MSRHAGFAAAATVTEKTINDVIASYSRSNLGPLFFPLPQTITVGPNTIVFSGVMQMFAPTIELHATPANAVIVHFVFQSILRAQYGALPMQTWIVQGSETVTVGLVTTIQNNRIVLGIDTQQVTLQPLQVQVLQGPALPAPILNALQSPALAAAATNFVQSLPPITISPPMLTSQINFTQPLALPWIVAPSWFTINLTVSQIAVKVLEKAITVAVDFAGFTSGNANDLIDLTAVKGSGSIYKHHFIQAADSEYGPILSRHPEPKGGSIATAVNMDVISAVVDQQVSPQIFSTGGPNGQGTPVSTSPDVSLMSVSAGYATFNKPLQPGFNDGLAVNFHVRVEEGPWFGVDGRLLLQVYLREADGTTEFVNNYPDVWRIHVAKVEVDLPAWIDVAVLGLTIYFSAAIPMIAPLMGITAIALFVDVIPGLQANVESQAQLGLQSAANGVEFPAPWSAPLPGLTAPDWNGSLKYVSVTPEGVDVGVNMSPSSDVNAEPLGTIAPPYWEASNTSPIELTLKLRDDLEAPGGSNLMVSWSVRRADTNQVVATGAKVYNDPAGNGILVAHHTPALYHVDAFIVSCTATVTLGSQVGDVWSGTMTLPIVDNLDRHRKYVEWGPHVVHFENAGTNHAWWQHTRKSRIHRTAVSARCKMLREAAAMHKFTNFAVDDIPFTTITYKDLLPFPWSQLNSNRKPLCEYCFFGGPDKTVPFPQDDWF